jgi:hypothetical protein
MVRLDAGTLRHWEKSVDFRLVLTVRRFLVFWCWGGTLFVAEMLSLCRGLLLQNQNSEK